jgi:putative acetyltransferase
MREAQVGSEKPEHAAGISRVHELAFGCSDEARLVEALRDGGCLKPALSLVAEIEGRVVGHALFSELPIEHQGGSSRGLALAPVGVLPELQRSGIGSRLIREGIARAGELGYAAILVLGSPAYYRRFGFDLSLGRCVHSVYSGPHFMGLELRPAALTALRDACARYPAAFSELE